MRQNVSAEPQELSARTCDVLIVVPPFFEPRYPSLGAHVLQACARAAGFRVRAFYANLLFVSHIGLPRYTALSQAPLGTFLGERLFARAAYGVPPLGAQANMFAPERIYGFSLADTIYQDDPAYAAYRLEALRTEAQVPEWVEAAGKYIAGLGIPIIGATTTFQQTAPAIALLAAIRRHAGGVTTIIGGANCEGEMAEGIRSIAPFIDYVFSGESEHTFPEFLHGLARREPPAGRIIRGKPCNEMDAIPPLDYDDYFEQRAAYLSRPDDAAVGGASVPYETSRGCWWGQKHHCTFCGLNGEGMEFRSRSPDRVIGELRALAAKYRPASVIMADNIMPYTYFSTVVPRLATELPGLNIYYEQKANLPRERLVLLKRAGINTIQPGIEALSSELLTLMRKGTTARQNIALLRDARGVQITIAWGLLWGFPGDRPAWYEKTLAMLPLLHHLQPPGAFSALGLDRFSPYFNQAEQFGISDVRPYPAYRDFLPAGAPVEKVAYHFTGAYRCAAVEAPNLMRALHEAVGAWQASWTGRVPPELRIRKYAGAFCLVDTRGLPGCQPMEFIGAREARRLVVSEPYDDSPEQRSLIGRNLALCLDGYFVPLAVADESIFMRLNEAAVSTRRGGEQRVGTSTAHPDRADQTPAGQVRRPPGPASPPLIAISGAPVAP
jgi:ribosomal peptide maturation radical SAM protein 1